MRIDGDSIYACPWEYDSMFEVVEWAIEKVIAERKFKKDYHYILNHKKYMVNTHLIDWFISHHVIQGDVWDFERVMGKVFDLDAIIEREDITQWII